MAKIRWRRFGAWLSAKHREAFAPPVPGESFYRHRALVRLTHWINALCIVFCWAAG